MRKIDALKALHPVHVYLKTANNKIKTFTNTGLKTAR
jgi:hypothetical protein